MNKLLGHYVKMKKASHEGQILYEVLNQIHKDRKKNEWWLLGARRKVLLFNGYRFQFCKMKKFWKWMVVMVAQQYECI